MPRKPKEILITASIGLYHCKQFNRYYLQVIPATTENSYLVPIPEHVAKEYASEENLEIAPITYEHVTKYLLVA